MGNKFYTPGEPRAAKVRDLFDKVAPQYDLINDLQSIGLHRVWKRRLVEMARLQPGDWALDLCCGTGDVTFALARKGAHVIGVDFSEAMIEVARHRSPAENPPSFVRADCLRLPFPAARFDAVTISYGLRNLSNFELAVREMLRVLKPGGRLVILDFGKPDNALLRRIYFGYLGLIVPIFGKVFCGDTATHSYILESLKHYPAQRGVAALLSDMNCAHVRTLNLFGGMMSINYGERAPSP